MARIARVVAPGLPHYVTRRGNRRQQTFFCDDRLVKVSPLLELVDDWGEVYCRAERELSLLRRHERTSMPLDGESFFDRLERELGRSLRKQKPGPKPNERTR
jgi:putative transposase